MGEAARGLHQLSESEDSLQQQVHRLAQRLVDAPDDGLRDVARCCAEAGELLAEAGRGVRCRSSAWQSCRAWQVEQRLAGYDALQRKHGADEGQLMDAWSVIADRVASLE